MRLVKDIRYLRNVSHPVKLNRGRQLGRDMLAFLKRYNREYPTFPGIGLSAIQVGYPEQVIVLLPPVNKKEYILVNPRLVEKSLITTEYKERCLSLSRNIEVITTRSIWIRIETENLGILTEGLHPDLPDEYPPEQALLEAVCLAHELDHLQGKLITDFIY